MDCTSLTGNAEFTNLGCAGGYLEPSWSYVKQNAIFEQAIIPYTATEQGCNYDQMDKAHFVNSHVLDDHIAVERTPAALVDALKKGPVVATIRAGNPIFRHFSKGVIRSEECRAKYDKHPKHDHAVLVVGHGEAHLGGKYFVIKNSFSAHWGSKGYAKIGIDSTSEDGYCGLFANL